MSNREEMLRRLSAVLADRALYWFGIRGSDAEGLLALPQFSGSFAITSAIDAPGLAYNVTLEQLTGVRVDLDRYDIDFDQQNAEAIATMRRHLLAALAEKSAIVTYRPSEFLSSISFATRRNAAYLGMFKGCQSAFEHKPWVETELDALGMRTLPWEYVPIEARHSVIDRLATGPVILRPSRTSGGVGIEIVAEPDELIAKWSDDPSHVMGVSRFLEDALPLNVGGCVFGGGEVTLHPASLQLIGVRGATSRRFGYCGNDFAAFANISGDIQAEIDDSTRMIGRWLGTRGYLGAFGVDYLLHEGWLYFAEVNARFQGSTALTVALSAGAGECDILLDHLAANLGVTPVANHSLGKWADLIGPGSHVVMHNCEPHRVVARSRCRHPHAQRVELVPPRGSAIEVGGVIGRLVFGRRITRDGFHIDVELTGAC